MSGYEHVDPNDIEGCSRFWSTLGSAETERLLGPMKQTDPNVIHANYTRKTKLAKANLYLDYTAQLLQLNGYAFPDAKRRSFMDECNRLLALSASPDQYLSSLAAADAFKDDSRRLYTMTSCETCGAIVKTVPLGMGLPPQYSP